MKKSYLLLFMLLSASLIFICGSSELNNSSTTINKRIVVMGSSTSAGYGVPPDSSWVRRMSAYFKNLGLVDTVFNIAQSSTNCYTGMPSNYVPPPGRDHPNPNLNISKAISYNPGIIIVNYPTNQYDWLTNEEILSCLQTIYDSATARGIKCYITTTQPRDGFSPLERQKLKVIKQLIVERFGQHSIDFWTDITLEPSLTIKPQYALGDNVHLNAAGHSMLNAQVIARDIFGINIVVPIKFANLHAWYTDPRNIKVSFNVNDPAHIQQYNIMISNDGKKFRKVKTIIPGNEISTSYSTTISLN